MASGAEGRCHGASCLPGSERLVFRRQHLRHTRPAALDLNGVAPPWTRECAPGCPGPSTAACTGATHRLRVVRSPDAEPTHRTRGPESVRRAPPERHERRPGSGGPGRTLDDRGAGRSLMADRSGREVEGEQVGADWGEQRRHQIRVDVRAGRRGERPRVRAHRWGRVRAAPRRRVRSLNHLWMSGPVRFRRCRPGSFRRDRS